MTRVTTEPKKNSNKEYIRLKRNFLDKIVNGFDEYIKFIRYQEKERRRQMAKRKNYITGWYTSKECERYWKAIGNRDFSKLKNLCRCNKNGECPSCQILRLKQQGVNI